VRRLGVRDFKRRDLRSDRRRQRSVAGNQLALEKPFAPDPPIFGNTGAVEAECDALKPQRILAMQRLQCGWLSPP
jgi:hypothetical protein